MKYLVIAAILLAAGCGGGNAADPGNETKDKAPTPAKTKVAQDNTKEGTAPPSEEAIAAEKNAIDTDADAKAAKANADAKAQEIRQGLLQAKFDSYSDVVLTQSSVDLEPGEKEMLKHLLEAASLIEQLHMLQIHPENLAWQDEIEKSGTPIEKQIMKRYQSPWCDEKECCALKANHPKEVGFIHWPKDMSDAEYESMTKQINAKELLSPFTIVRRKEGGGFDAIPFSQTEVFAKRMKKVAASLREAAKTAPDKTLKKFLQSRADAFEADSAFPYDESDYDWIATKGKWDVTIGPYETYSNPRQLKASFEMYIGRTDDELTGQLARFKKNLQEMENALSMLVGPEIYPSRKLDKRIAIRAVDIWMATGGGRAPHGATVAFHLPNRGKSVEEGLYKKVMMINHSKAFETLTKGRAGVILDEAQQKYVNVRSDITNVTFHEFSHGFGAFHEMKITTPKGKTVTVKQALKELDSLLEEAKADVFGLWLIDFQKTKGWIDEEQANARYLSGFMHILGLLQYPLKGTYPPMVAIQVGWYLDAGALVWNAETRRFTVVVEKMPEAINSLAKKVATIQLSGDYAQGKELFDTYITKKGPGEEYDLKGTLGEARKVMMEKFKAAGLQSPSLSYRITGL